MRLFSNSILLQLSIHCCLNMGITGLPIKRNIHYQLRKNSINQNESNRNIVSSLTPSYYPYKTTILSSTASSENSNTIQILKEDDEPDSNFNASFYFNIDKQIANIAVPAFVSLFADPLASMVWSNIMYIYLSISCPRRLKQDIITCSILILL